MATRKIQLDDDAEATLSVLCDQTGLSISEVLKSVCGVSTQGTNSRNAISGL